MPTLSSSPYRFALVLLVATTAQAQDLHIKKSITVGGNFVSSTETSIKGARERTVSQTPTGNTITIRQCDLKQTININEQGQTYLVTKDAQDEAAIKAAAMVTGAPDATSGGYITETAAITDTGERKTMYGFPARHLKIKVTEESSKNACTQLSQSYEVDGWYADIGKEMASSCQQFLPPVRQSEGCSDRIIRKRSGSGKPGYPLSENITFHNADGTATTIGSITSEISKAPLEKELFEAPAGYREVKTLAELNGGPAQAPQAQQPQQQAAAGYGQQPQATGAAAGQQKQQMMKMMNPVTAAMNPAAAKAANAQALANAQQQMAMGNAAMSQLGMSGMQMGGNPAAGNPYAQGGMQGSMPGAPQAAASAPVGPKQKGKVRIGVAPPDAQVGQGNNSGGDYSTPIRNAEIALMSGPAVDVVPLDSHIAMQLQAEAAQKQCDYVLFSSVQVKHAQSSFGKFAKYGSMAANVTPYGMMSHGMASAAAASAAGAAASQMAQQQAMNQLSQFNGQIKSKDDVTVQYQLVPNGQTQPALQNTLQGKAKSNGEDVLTPLLTQTAEAVLTQVSQPAQTAQAAQAAQKK